MIHALRRKFVLITMLLVSVVLLGVFAGVFIYNQASQERQSYLSLQLALEKQPGEFSRMEIGGDVPEGYARDAVFLVSVDKGGRAVLLASDRVNVNEEQIKQIVTDVLSSEETQGEILEYDLRYMMKRMGGGSARIAFSTLSVERSLIREYMLVTAFGILGAFLFFLAASIILSRWVLKPVEAAWAEQNRFIADASHELKTPLTVILANTNILQASPETTGEQRTWIDSTEKEATRMKDLVGSLLFLAKRESGAPPHEKTTNDFSVLAETTALAFESVAYEQNRRLSVEVEPGIVVVGDAAQLNQLVGILVDNAVKYAKDGSEIQVRLKRHQGMAVLTVFNEGEMIPPDQQKRLFDRFYRTDTSRSTEGTGLGLAIAKVMAEEHRGRIAVESDERGTLFTVSLPAVE